ncbi:ribosomal small subunit pseudouridine synthase A [Liquorilactobacillus aquaticus DSM 21051]|uniref:Pseudouridine synthase n=1 Tax=Liquorilactobacillus aquaticus DSM 21051 TaxID=1423725 RepID=A0A0R2CUX4_9LACO|nr:pseudouridine synthase [Liquorilactobacillus aquaticus]KRM95248.1 ribosomal small subunit pseudouridine synthase A [Liquorilactobacillus aquaticus DSM 21051]
MRLDKYLANMGLGTRSEVRKIIKDGRVTVNSHNVLNGKKQIKEQTDKVQLDNKILDYQKFFYYMLNKPQGVISATSDMNQKTVLDLLDKNDQQQGLFPVGRLDKNTTGLLLITNDGKLAHQLLSPVRHVNKVYEVKVAGIVDENAIAKLTSGILLKDGTQTKEAKVRILKSKDGYSWIRITISEGKYHQIKRMFGALSMRVVALERVEMGPLRLDTTLTVGKYRELTNSEVLKLRKG